MTDASAKFVKGDEEQEVDSNYKPPPEKTIDQILEADKEDESLRKYKETLLGEAKLGGIIVGRFIECNLKIKLFKLLNSNIYIF